MSIIQIKLILQMPLSPRSGVSGDITHHFVNPDSNAGCGESGKSVKLLEQIPDELSKLPNENVLENFKRLLVALLFLEQSCDQETIEETISSQQKITKLQRHDCDKLANFFSGLPKKFGRIPLDHYYASMEIISDFQEDGFDPFEIFEVQSFSGASEKDQKLRFELARKITRLEHELCYEINLEAPINREVLETYIKTAENPPGLFFSLFDDDFKSMKRFFLEIKLGAKVFVS